ncbi:MAG TPA: hypothetical protein VEF04_08155 [Blastocatellia bacterium]|nr:hypothetical protein [Blastocatellia bacterium]
MPRKDHFVIVQEFERFCGWFILLQLIYPPAQIRGESLYDRLPVKELARLFVKISIVLCFAETSRTLVWYLAGPLNWSTVGVWLALMLSDSASSVIILEAAGTRNRLSLLFTSVAASIAIWNGLESELHVIALSGCLGAVVAIIVYNLFRKRYLVELGHENMLRSLFYVPIAVSFVFSMVDLAASYTKQRSNR